MRQSASPLLAQASPSQLDWKVRSWHACLLPWHNNSKSREWHFHIQAHRGCGHHILGLKEHAQAHERAIFPYKLPPATCLEHHVCLTNCI